MGTIGARARSWINARLATMEPSSGRPYGAPEGPHALRARSDRIEAVLPMRDWRPAPDEAVVDVAGRWITPGLVDCHTHLVWGGDRAREFERRLAGASYVEIAAGGGGIRATVQATRGFGGGTRPRGRRAAHAAPRRRRIEFRIRTRYCDAKAASLDEALGLLDEARGGNRPRSIALVGNAAEGLKDRARLGRAFNAMVASGEMAAPIVIGRDHLDSGSVASPNRETEAMRDGSDAVSDWPLLNALLNTASGATWVSLHHGGGVGMGFGQHAGMVAVCDGSPDADRRLARVLRNDPGTDVMRHAGCGDAIACAREEGLDLPMLEGP